VRSPWVIFPNACALSCFSSCVVGRKNFRSFDHRVCTSFCGMFAIVADLSHTPRIPHFIRIHTIWYRREICASGMLLSKPMSSLGSSKISFVKYGIKANTNRTSLCHRRNVGMSASGLRIGIVFSISNRVLADWVIGIGMYGGIIGDGMSPLLVDGVWKGYGKDRTGCGGSIRC